ncbi:MAG: DUF72 domain-containing protein [Acidobacteriales bacterium]|nr:DUF72 domain-containing protein [Terriglobales bacterium]
MHSIRIGCAGWTIPRVAAANFLSGGSHLERYSQVFNCCEINSSFYREHETKTWERWAASVPSDFRFSVKVPKAITHDARLNCGVRVLSAFLRQLRPLREKLGPLLIQLPPSLEFDTRSVSKFLRLLRQKYPGEVVCEPRHSSWFNASVDDVLAEYDIGRVAADPACVPAASTPSGSPNLAYFRLHGSPRRYYSAYSAQFLQNLSLQMKKLAEKAEVWCIFDNTASGSAIENALESRSLCGRSLMPAHH